MLLWEHKIYYSSFYECSQFPKCNYSFQVLIHKMVNKVWLKFFLSHQAQFPILDLKEWHGHCQNKVYRSLNQSQTYCEFSKTAPLPDILHQLSEPCLLLAQRLGVQKIENPARASSQQLLVPTVTCLVSTERDPELCRDSTQHCSAFTPGSTCPPRCQSPTQTCQPAGNSIPFFILDQVSRWNIYS